MAGYPLFIWIVNLNSGAPITITANNSLYGNARPDIVGPFPVKDGKVILRASAKKEKEDDGATSKPG